MKKLLTVLLFLIVSLQASEFEQGSVGVGVSFGLGSMEVNNHNEHYTLAGASINYFVIDDFSFGLRYLGWFGGTPPMHEVSIPLNYYYPYSSSIRPFGGVFVKQTFVGDGYDDYDSYGARVGVLMHFGKGACFRIGAVQEYYGNCSLHNECSGVYPEAMLFIAF